MILSLGRESFHREAYLLCLASVTDEATFLRRAKVRPGTYAGELFEDLYDGIFRQSLELKRDFTVFYTMEYPTFAEYLQKRFLFEENIVSEAGAQFSKSEQIIHFHPGYCFLEEDYGREFLEKLLEPSKDNEN